MQVPDFVRQDVPLAYFSTLGVGGRADYFATIDSLRQLEAAHDFASKNHLDILVIGRGSNILFSGRGFRGLVARMNIRELNYHRAANEHWVNAGILVSEIVSLGEDLGFSGFESFAGLPGTVGGATCGNAGCYGKQFWDVVEEVKFLYGGYFGSGIYEIHQENIQNEPALFGYRWSIFKDNPNWIIISVKLKFEPSDNEMVIAETKRIRKLRYASQPTQANVGCIFKNPSGDRSAGQLIDLAGLKGLKLGGAQISEKHANFFVNLGDARASDFIELIKIAKGRVLEKFGILLKEKIIMVGEF